MSEQNCKPYIPVFHASITAQIEDWRCRGVYVENKVIPGYSDLQEGPSTHGISKAKKVHSFKTLEINSCATNCHNQENLSLQIRNLTIK
jgi:hypothetical protein